MAQWAESYRAFWQVNLASLKQHVERKHARRNDP
jgi:hypothetical protein